MDIVRNYPLSCSDKFSDWVWFVTIWLLILSVLTLCGPWRPGDSVISHSPHTIICLPSPGYFNGFSLRLKGSQLMCYRPPLTTSQWQKEKHNLPFKSWGGSSMQVKTLMRWIRTVFNLRRFPPRNKASLDMIVKLSIIKLTCRLNLPLLLILSMKSSPWERKCLSSDPVSQI